MYVCICMYVCMLPVAGGGGGSGGRTPPPPQLPIPKILFHPLAWGPIKVTIPSSYRWKYAPLWLINHPRRLELDSLFLPWYRQPNHTLYIVFHPSKFRPPPPTWMAGYGPDVCMYVCMYVCMWMSEWVCACLHVYLSVCRPMYYV